MRFVRIPGFHPINWYVWHRHDGKRPWPDRHRRLTLLRERLRLLWTHRRIAA